MKSFICTMFCLVLLIICYFDFNNFNGEKLLVDAVGYNVTFNEEINDINFNGVKNGTLYHVFNNTNNHYYINSLYNEKIVAETFVFSKSYDLNSFLNSINFVQTNSYVVNETKVIEGYTPKFEKYICSGFNKVNLQIAISDQIKIGYPYIAEGF